MRIPVLSGTRTNHPGILWCKVSASRARFRTVKILNLGGLKLQYTYQKRTHSEVLVCTTYMNWIIVGHFPDLHKTEKIRFMISGSILHIRLRQRGIGLCCDVTAQGSE